MTGLLNELVTVARGFATKIEETMERLAKEGEKASKGLPPGKELENRLVECSVEIIKEGIDKGRKGFDRVEAILIERLSSLMERLDLVREERVDVLEKVLQRTRGMVEELEKRVERLEAGTRSGEDR